MKIIYLPKTFTSGETLNYHGIYDIEIDTENKRCIVSVGSWENLLESKRMSRPNIISKVILNYESWIPEFYNNIFNYVFSSSNWQGWILVEDDISIPLPELQSRNEINSINQLWLNMNSGIIPKVEPFFSEYTLR